MWFPCCYRCPSRTITSYTTYQHIQIHLHMKSMYQHVNFSKQVVRTHWMFWWAWKWCESHCGFYSHQISTQLNTYDRYWSDVLMQQVPHKDIITLCVWYGRSSIASSPPLSIPPQRTLIGRTWIIWYALSWMASSRTDSEIHFNHTLSPLMHLQYKSNLLTGVPQQSSEVQDQPLK